jgi:hypothetical protein
MVNSAYSQTPNQPLPYQFQYYQNFDKIAYSTENKFHSSLKPYFFDDSLIHKKYNTINSLFSDTVNKSFLHRKIFNEHLIDVVKDEYTFYLDFLPDFQVGKSSNGDMNTWLNTRGFQVGGTIGTKFTFYTSGFENQSVFPKYLNDYILRTNIVPGQSYDRKPQDQARDWSYSTAVLSYTPVKYLNLTLAQDKLFIGDGYRSMLLSDYGTNYPFLKATVNLGSVQYSSIWTSFQEPFATKFSYDAGNRKKGGVFHYLDWAVNNRLSLGFFDAIIWAAADDLGNRRGFDFTYINPFIFLRPVEAMNGSPDNAMIGLTSKYEISKYLTAYGQFALDEFEAKNFFSKSGSSRNKWGIQLGLKGIYEVNEYNKINYLLEYNASRPYTYSSRNLIGSYTNYSEPLAHPYGANFKEIVGVFSYNYKRFNLFTKINSSKYGYDLNGNNYGKNPFRPYLTAVQSDGNTIGQGLETDMLFLESRLSFLINYKTNLRVELGLISRNEKNININDKTNWVTLGLRSSFRNLYYDF